MLVTTHRILIDVWNSFFDQIMSMIEEATGTRLYETKKESAQKTIEKKDAKLREIDSVSKFIHITCILCLVVVVINGLY